MALVTGGSSGIGLEITKQLGEMLHHATLVAVAAAAAGHICTSTHVNQRLTRNLFRHLRLFLQLVLLQACMGAPWSSLAGARQC